MMAKKGAGRYFAQLAQEPRRAQAPGSEQDPKASLAFPEEVIKGAAGDFTDSQSKSFESPKQFWFMAYLTCLGLLVADQLSLNSGLSTQPRLYTLLLGESADDRKSTVLDKTVDFFTEVSVGLPVCRGVGSAEGLLYNLERFKKVLLVYDEFKLFAEKCKAKGSTLLPCANTLFESNRYENRTKSKGAPLDGLYMSLLAASTIDTYENTWSSQYTDIGFSNRLWIVPGSADRKFSIPTRPDPGEVARLKEGLSAVLRFVESNGELTLSSKGRALWDRWYLDPNRRHSAHSKRLDTYGLRLMPLLAANQMKAEVDAETVRDTILLINNQLAVRELFDPISAENRGAKLEEKIRRVLTEKGPLTQRDLFNLINAKRYGLFPAQLALDNCLKNKQIRRKPGDKKLEIAF